MRVSSAWGERGTRGGGFASKLLGAELFLEELLLKYIGQFVVGKYNYLGLAGNFAVEASFHFCVKFKFIPTLASYQ